MPGYKIKNAHFRAVLLVPLGTVAPDVSPGFWLL